jgi:ParB family chromosome partitioning protein
VTLRRKGDRYEIIAGERRVRAARLLEWATIPAYVREAGDREMLELAILENLQRADLNPIDVATAYRRLMDDFRLTQEQVATKVGSSRSQVANTLRLLELQAEIRVMLSKGEITPGAGRSLLAFDDPRRRLELARQVAAGPLYRAST